MAPRRPNKMTPDNVSRILTALRAGNTRRAASGYGHIDENTLGNWMNRFLDFREQVVLAENEAEVTVVSNLLAKVQQGDVKAITFWLERRRRADWGPQVDVNIRLEVERLARELDLDPEELLAEAERIVHAH